MQEHKRMTENPTSYAQSRFNIKYFNFFALVSRQSAVLSSTIQHTMSPEFSGKWGTEYLNLN